MDLQHCAELHFLLIGRDGTGGEGSRYQKVSEQALKGDQ
jgi:hypothetical protein